MKSKLTNEELTRSINWYSTAACYQITEQAHNIVYHLWAIYVEVNDIRKDKRKEDSCYLPDKLLEQHLQIAIKDGNLNAQAVIMAINEIKEYREEEI